MWLIFALIFGFMAIFGIVHQHLLLFYIFGVDEWVDWSQLMHHEALIGICLSLAIWELLHPWVMKGIRYLVWNFLANDRYMKD